MGKKHKHPKPEDLVDELNDIDPDDMERELDRLTEDSRG